MSRLPQKADVYADQHFLKHFEIQQVNYNLKTQAMLANKIGISQATVGNHKKDPSSIQVNMLRKYINALHLKPFLLLEFLGYSKNEIKKEWDLYQKGESV